jgi:hypothetical protein
MDFRQTGSSIAHHRPRPWSLSSRTGVFADLPAYPALGSNLRRHFRQSVQITSGLPVTRPVRTTFGTRGLEQLRWLAESRTWSGFRARLELAYLLKRMRMRAYLVHAWPRFYEELQIDNSLDPAMFAGGALHNSGSHESRRFDGLDITLCSLGVSGPLLPRDRHG